MNSELRAYFAFILFVADILPITYWELLFLERFMHVLVIDDDSRLRLVLARMLRAGGFDSIQEAADGEEALASLAKRGADLIITDCQMPRMDGITFVRQLRGRGDRTPIIMLSGQGDPHLIVTAIKAGVDNYLPKPINPDVLFEKIEQTLGVRKE